MSLDQQRVLHHCRQDGEIQFHLERRMKLQRMQLLQKFTLNPLDTICLLFTTALMVIATMRTTPPPVSDRTS